MKKLVLSIIVLISVFSANAQKLAEFSLTMPHHSYISITNKQVYTETQAAAARAALDFLYSVKPDGKDTVRTFYNMSSKSDPVPENLRGTTTGVVAISWDKDLFNSCKTVADLKRMAGHITHNSFSFYAIISNNHTGMINYSCFIFQLASGKRGVMYIEKAGSNGLGLKIKMEP